MAIDPNIALQLHPMQIESPLNALQSALQVQGAQQSNQLNNIKLQQMNQANDRQNKLLQLVQGLPADTTDEQRIQALKGGGFFNEADTLEKGMIERQKGQSESALKMADVQNKAAAQHRDQLAGVNTPEDAAAWIDGGYKDPVLSPILSRYATPEQAKARIPTDPDAFNAWKQQAALGATKFIEQNKPTISTRNLGGTTQTIGTEGLTGKTTVLNSAQNTQSPDNAATNFTTQRGQNMQDARERAKQDESDIGQSAVSLDAIKNAAARYNIDGTLPPLGLGKQGAATRAAILNEAATQSQGISPDDQRIAQIGNKANSAALGKLQQQQTMVGAFEKNFNKNADIALEYSGKVDNTGVPIVNKWINAGKAATGDPDVAAYNQSIKSVVNEYSKIVSGSMGNTALAEGEIKKVESLLNSAQTPAQVTAVVNLMKRETANRMQGFEDEKAQLKQGMSRKPAAASTAPASTSTSKPSLSDIFGK